jgi:hypothetical protein
MWKRKKLTGSRLDAAHAAPERIRLGFSSSPNGIDVRQLRTAGGARRDIASSTSASDVGRTPQWSLADRGDSSTSSIELVKSGVVSDLIAGTRGMWTSPFRLAAEFPCPSGRGREATARRTSNVSARAIAFAYSFRTSPSRARDPSFARALGRLQRRYSKPRPIRHRPKGNVRLPLQDPKRLAADSTVSTRERMCTTTDNSWRMVHARELGYFEPATSSIGANEHALDSNPTRIHPARTR